MKDLRQKLYWKMRGFAWVCNITSAFLQKNGLEVLKINDRELPSEYGRVEYELIEKEYLLTKQLGMDFRGFVEEAAKKMTLK